MNDILLNEDGTPKIVDGDLVIGYSDIQHQAIILEVGKGGIKHFPSLGVNISSSILDEGSDNLLLSIRKEFKRDNMKINTLKIIDSKLKIDARYENV